MSDNFDNRAPPPIGFRHDIATPDEISAQFQYPTGFQLSYGQSDMPPMPIPMPIPHPVILEGTTETDLVTHFDAINIETVSTSSSSTSSSSPTPSRQPQIFSQYKAHSLQKQRNYGYSWQSFSVGAPFPFDNAVRSGTDSDGTPIYVGRAAHEGEMIPAKVMPDKHVAYIAYGGAEHPKYEFEILTTGSFAWEFSSNGEVPFGAVSCGETASGERLYYGRCLYEGSQTPGKIQVSHGCLYIPFGGQEVSVCEYEVLVFK